MERDDGESGDVNCGLAGCGRKSHPELFLVTKDAEGNEVKVPICRKCHKMVESMLSTAPKNYSIGAKV